MITLHILQLLEDNGFGTIDALENGLFWESQPLNATGITIKSRGGVAQRGSILAQSFDLYSRGSTDLLGADRLEKIITFFRNNFVQCELPETPKSSKRYVATTVEVVGNVEQMGLGSDDRMVFRIPVVLKYKLDS